RRQGRQDQQGGGARPAEEELRRAGPEQGWVHRPSGDARRRAGSAGADGPQGQRRQEVTRHPYPKETPMRRFVLPTLLLLLPTLPVPAQYPPQEAWEIARGWYTRYLGRVPGQAEAQGWVDALARGDDPTHLLATFLGTDEYYIRAGSNPA